MGILDKIRDLVGSTPQAEEIRDFDDVRDEVQFTGFSNDQQEVILSQLEKAWDTDSGRDMIEDGLDGNGLHYLNVNDQNVISTVAPQVGVTADKVPDFGNFAIPANGAVYLNGYDALSADGSVQTYTSLHPSLDGLQAIADTPIRSLDVNGEVFSVPPIYTMLHETNHAARGEADLPRSQPTGIHYDSTLIGTTSGEAAQAYAGQNEVSTRQILTEMGIDQQRGGYGATGGIDDVPIGSDYGLGRDHDVSVTSSQGIDMTGHAPVDATVVGYSSAEIKAAAADQGVTFTDTQSLNFVSNTFRLGNANDTVHVFDGNDVVHTGAGDDRVFLGAGNDTAHAGWGANRIDGGDANLDPASDHRSDMTTNWGFDTVDYTTMPTGFASPDALQASATFDGAARDGIYITMDGNDISITKGQENSVRVGEDVDNLHNIDAVRGTGRDDLTEVSALSGNRAIDGAGGTDTLRIDGLPEGTTVSHTPGAITFNGATYNGVISDGTNNLYYTNYENIVLPKVEVPGTDAGAGAVDKHIEANGVDVAPNPTPIDASLDGAPTQTLPMEDAVRILHEEGAEAVAQERAAGIENGPVATMIETPAGISAFETLVENGETSIEVDAAEMAGDAQSRVSSVLRGSLERVHEIDKVTEAETRHSEHLEQELTAEASMEAEMASAQYNAPLVEAEMEYDHSL